MLLQLNLLKQMKKSVLLIPVVFLSLSNSYAADAVVAVDQNNTSKSLRNGSIEIVKDLKEQDKAGYAEALNAKKITPKNNVVTTKVVPANGVKEVVVEPTKVTDSKDTTASDQKGKIGETKSIGKSQSSVGKEVVVEAAKVQDTKELTASDQKGKVVAAKPVGKSQPLKVVNSEEVVLDAADYQGGKRKATRSGSDKSSGDYAVPEAGGRVVEKITRKENVEKMIPPPDDVIYGALKRAESKSTSANSAIVIEAIQGINELVTISRLDLNRFVTPFEKVKVRTVAGEDELVSKIDGNIVYLGATKKAGVFLTEVGSDRAISLTLVPDDVPPRDIYIKLNRSSNIPAQLANVSKNVAKANGISTGSSNASDGPGGKTLPHVDLIKDTMRDMALGKIPGGYTMTVPKSGEFKCSIPGFRMRLGQSIEGSNTKIMVLRAENSSSTNEATIDEQYCYKRGVVAVAAWPDVVVPPGGATEIYVITKILDGKLTESTRPSLVGRDPSVRDDRDEY